MHKPVVLARTFKAEEQEEGWVGCAFVAVAVRLLLAFLFVIAPVIAAPSARWRVTPGPLCTTMDKSIVIWVVRHDESSYVRASTWDSSVVNRCPRRASQ